MAYTEHFQCIAVRFALVQTKQYNFTLVWQLSGIYQQIELQPSLHSRTRV